jgi:AcrR family transcriptional regulator
MKAELAKDVENLFASEVDLSEDFKNKAASLFEAVVTARVSHEVEKMQDALAEQAAQAVVNIHEEMVSNIDAYLSYVAEQWLASNEVAIETGLRAEVTEDFIAGLKVLFKEHYIEVPEEKYDVLGDMQNQIDELTTQVNESLAKAIELNTELNESKREVAFSRATSDLAQTEVEKLRSLVEEVEFGNEELFEQKISVIKNNYFPKSTVSSPITEEVSETQEVSGTVARYAEMLSRNTFGK